ncbi:translation Initiation factor eIF- 4e, partial [Kipferlia bialata]
PGDKTHPLSRPWTLYLYHDDEDTRSTQQTDYMQSIKPLFTAQTVEDFWAGYQWVTPPNCIPVDTILYMFPNEDMPCWEDVNNRGRLVVPLKK